MVSDITSISKVLAVVCLTIVDIRLAIVNECLSLVIHVGHLRRGRDLIRNVVDYVLDRVLLG